MERVWRADGPLDLHRTLALLRHATKDPTHRTAADGALWRATRTPDGPASYRLVQTGPEVGCTAWGPGAAWVLDGLPELLGRHALFDPRHPLLVRAHRRHPGLRIPRSRRVFESLVPAVIEQKVTGKEAREAYVLLLRRYGEPAPGPVPAGLLVPPSPDAWLHIPSWEWHLAGVDPRRMRTVLAAARVAERLEEAVTMSPEDARARLTAVPGVGEWTAAEVAVRALGDTDAVSVGDYHLAGHVGWALVGRPVGDEEMVALLEPWRPQRARVVRLIELSGAAKPRFGPRMTVQDHRSH
ncbi:MAG TPA: DNA-3-methyladenine glycosylase 2 family protein [Mycobacteriales bacterium]|nr:DNA-3-methyladenine glycosylase 2 family protein [Mycobacteriales bacterium]